MAYIPYLVLGPTGLMGLIGLLYGPDKTIPTPNQDWKKATVDLLIPSYNEEATILLCLDSITRQTLQPRQILLYDDASTDRTCQFARDYAQLHQINLKIIKRTHNEGKTPSVYYAAHESDADVLAIVDGDSILKSDDYLARLTEELYQGVGIACACGMVLPLTEQDRNNERMREPIAEFARRHPETPFSPDKTKFQLFQRAITNAYREELYLFLQRFIYHGEMVFFGTIIFPIGCAVVYRREYLKDILDHYTKIFGFDLTTSEDIFFGFAFADKGYRNIVVQNTYALTMEPRYFGVYKQINKWHSSFLQSCYYFDSLFFTPFKFPRLLIKKIKDARNPELKKMVEKRKIQEAYRQAFGVEYTIKYGRNIGWFVFTTTFEKLSFPTVIIILIILQYWLTLLATIGSEVALYAIIIATMHKNRRFRNFFKAILFTPIRYSQIMFDIVVLGKFMSDLWITKNRRWRK
ncbi:MAG: glycosyltransferase [Legionellaceae bacterium]|nr:glycosyltransferase [Legionellaceae bacterium]